MKRVYITAAIAILFVAMVAFMFAQRSTISRLRSESNRQGENVRALVERARVRTVRDSLRAVETQALRLQVDELEQYRRADADLIRDLRLRLRDVRSVTATATVYRDTVVLYVDSTDIKAQDDAPLSYHDKWTTISFSPSDSTLSYTFRDSVTNVLHIHYNRRFLWWRWRPVYRVTTVSHNPRCVSVQTSGVVVRSE